MENKLSKVPPDWGIADTRLFTSEMAWSDFESLKLQELITQSLSENPSVENGKLALERVALSQKLARQSGRIQYRSDFSYGAQWRETESANESFSVSVPFSYEVDLWGGVAAQVIQADLSEMSAQDAQQTLRVSIAAQVVSAYSDIVVQDTVLAIRQDQLKQVEQQIELQLARFNAGAVTRLGLDQLRVDKQARLAAIRTLIAERDISEQRLANLLGKAPHEFSISSLAYETFQVPQISLGDPLEVLVNRFDIRNAERRLKQADLSLYRARTAFLPSLSLRFALSNAGSRLKEFSSFEEATYQSVLSIAQNIFDDGDRKIRLNDARLAARQADNDFLIAMLGALAEVQGLLVQQDNIEAQRLIFDEQKSAQQSAAEIVEARYEAGTASAFDFIREQQNVLSIKEREVLLWRQEVGLRTQFLQSLSITP